MYGKRTLTTKEEEYFIPYFKYMISEIECGRRSEYDLSGKGINPSQVIKLMEQLGYPLKHIETVEEEMEMWLYFENTVTWVYINGLTFELSLNAETSFRVQNKIDFLKK